MKVFGHQYLNILHSKRERTLWFPSPANSRSMLLRRALAVIAQALGPVARQGDTPECLVNRVIILRRVALRRPCPGSLLETTSPLK